MRKNLLKFGGTGVILALIGIGAVWGVQYMQYRKSPEYRYLKEGEALQKRYMEDTYGGSTPEETLKLFIDALKKGDIDLASKYFEIQDQGKWKEYLSELKTSGHVSNAIVDAEKLKLSKQDGDRAFFTAVNEKNIVDVQVVLGKINGRWKILEL